MGNLVPSTREAVIQKSPNGTPQFSVVWYRFFDALSQSNQTPAAITVGASPFSYTAPQSGVVLISGGTVSLVEYGRNGVFTNIGAVAGPVPISQGDVVRVTYTVVPTMTFVRR